MTESIQARPLSAQSPLKTYFIERYQEFDVSLNICVNRSSLKIMSFSLCQMLARRNGTWPM